MNIRDLMLRLLKIAEQYNMDHKDLPSLLVKVTVISLKHIDRKNLFEQLFPGHFADWDLVNCNLGATNCLGDSEAWLCLLSLFNWPTLQAPLSKESRDIEQKHPTLTQIKGNLRANNLDNIDRPGWTTACCVLILQLIHGLPSLHAIEQLTSQSLQKNTHENTVRFLAGMCDVKHPPSEYLTTLLRILSPDLLQINEDILTQTMNLITAQKEEQKILLKLKKLQLSTLRPRLRDKLKCSLLTETRQERVD
jgi:hypothetical protein